MSKAYLTAVKQTDRRLGKLVAAVDADPVLRRNTVLMVTSDHGGKGVSHDMPTVFANYRVPFIVRGPGVPAGADLYDLNPTYQDPKRSRPTYDGPQPIRNGDVANLVTSISRPPARERERARRGAGPHRLRAVGPGGCSELSGPGPRVEPAATGALRLLHHHGRQLTGSGTAGVATAEPVAGLVVDHEVAVVAHRSPARLPGR